MENQELRKLSAIYQRVLVFLTKETLQQFTIEDVLLVARNLKQKLSIKKHAQ
jgi:hypothetical protein